MSISEEDAPEILRDYEIALNDYQELVVLLPRVIRTDLGVPSNEDADLDRRADGAANPYGAPK